MPKSVAQGMDNGSRSRAVAAVSELAGQGLAERMRVDAGVRVLIAARRLVAISPREAASGPASTVVLRVARSWESAAVTAAEHIEALAPVDLDAFLAAAPRWAASVRDATEGEARRAA
jgi:hypothetical protein